MMRLQFEGLTIARGTRILLRDIEADLHGGETIGILGSNGVGKTSLLLTLAGLLRPAAGRVRIDDTPLTALGARARACRIAWVDGAEPVLGALTVADTVASGRFAHHPWWDWQTDGADIEAVDDALAQVNLEHLRGRELGTLSAGERQRVWIAVAIAQRAGILLLDEPTSHLDLRYAVETLELIRALARGGTLVVAVLHDLHEAAAYCDRVLLLGDQRVLSAGPPSAALTAPVLEAAYGIAIDVEHGTNGMRFAPRAALR